MPGIQPPERACIDLADLVQRSVELVTTELRHSEIVLTRELATDVPSVTADAQQLQQVILNLLSNARQALASVPAPRRLRVALRHEGERALIEVEDNGPGVPEALRDRIFASFFTTRQEGTGLGLALCRRFMESNGGTIQLVPTAVGARFVLTLPV